MNLEGADVNKKEAFQRWVGARDDAARRVARRDLDAANVAWDAAWEVWARKVGLKA
jgi:hypothetical protein